MKENKNQKNNVILSETKNLIRSFTCVQDDNQRGRSMVEMLGVLAVIGVLSVAGIAGYSNAMKKYRANELLNEVSKRATIVAMQITSGRAPNISEFGNNVVQGITITANSYTAGAETFSFGLSSTGTELSDICPKMTEAVGENSFMSIAEGCGTITFKTDLSAGGSSSNEPVATCTPVCQPNEECVNGTCLPDADGASCMNNTHFCTGTNAPYCVVQYTNGNSTFTCQKNPTDYIDPNNFTICGEGYSGCGDLYCGGDGCCHSSLENVPCTYVSDCAGSDAPYCQPIVESGASYTPFGYYSYKCSTEAKRAYCNTDADCGDGYFCHPGYIRCCSSTNPESWCLDT